MAETEIVDFNVRLNELDLAQQLARVREQIELTMGAAASAATPHGGISNIVSPYVYTPPPPIPMEGVYSAPSQMQGLGDMLDSAARYTSLGFSKFNEDVRRVGLRANVFGDPTQLNAPPYGNAVIPQGTMGSFLGTVYPTFGGFDRNTARMTSTEFRQKSADVFNDNVTEMVVNNGFGMTGALGGLAVAGWGGALAGFGIGSTIDLVAQTFGRRANERYAMSSVFKEISSQTLGAMPTGQAMEVGRILQDKAYSYDGAARDFKVEDMLSNITAFANAGGLKNINNTDDLKREIKAVVDNTREFANVLRTSQQEAAQIMAELNQRMIVSTQDAATAGARFASIGASTGKTAMEVINFGMQGVEMLRGSGATAAQSFDLALSQRLQTERMMRFAPETREMVNDYGGADNFAIAQLEMQQRFMNSSQGMLTTAARLTGGNAAFTGSLGGMLSNAGQFFGSNPQNLFKMMSQQGRLAGAMSQEERLLQMTGTAMQVAGAMGFMDNGKVDTDTLAGISMNLFGMSSRDANAFVANVSSYKNADPRGDAMKQAIALREQQLQEHRLTIGDRFSGWWQENVSNNLVSASAEALIEMTRSNVSEGIRDISDSWNGISRIKTGRIYTNETSKRVMAEAMKDSSGFLEAQISENLTPAQKEEIIKRRRGDLDIAASNKLFSSGTVGETLLLGGSDTAVKAYQRAMSQNGLSLKESDFLLSNQLSDTSTLTTSDAARLTATQKQQALAGNTSWISSETEARSVAALYTLNSRPNEAVDKVKEKLSDDNIRLVGASLARGTNQDPQRMLSRIGDLDKKINSGLEDYVSTALGGLKTDTSTVNARDMAQLKAGLRRSVEDGTDPRTIRESLGNTAAMLFGEIAGNDELWKTLQGKARPIQTDMGTQGALRVHVAESERRSATGLTEAVKEALLQDTYERMTAMPDGTTFTNLNYEKAMSSAAFKSFRESQKGNKAFDELLEKATGGNDRAVTEMIAMAGKLEQTDLMAELNASRYGDNVLEQTQNKVFEKLDRALSEGVGIPVKLLDANTRNVRGRQVITSEPPNQNPLVQGLSNLWPF